MLQVVEAVLESASEDGGAVASSAGRADGTADAVANRAWPDFNATQALIFQQWYADKVDAKRKVAIKSIEWLTEHILKEHLYIYISIYI